MVAHVSVLQYSTAAAKGGVRVRCTSVRRERGQLSLARLFSISPFPPTFSPSVGVGIFYHIPQVCSVHAVKNSCRQVRSIRRENPFFFYSSSLLPTIIIHPLERIGPLPQFPSSHSYPGPPGQDIDFGVGRSTSSPPPPPPPSSPSVVVSNYLPPTCLWRLFLLPARAYFNRLKPFLFRE